MRSTMSSIRPGPYITRLLIVICGLFLFATGTVFTYRSQLGLGPWNVLQLGISLHTPLSLGTATMLIGALIIVCNLCLKVYPGVGTLLNMLLIGPFVDMQLRLHWLPDLGNSPWPLRLLVNVAGVLLVGLGTALYITPRLGAGPRDGLMLRLHTLTRLPIAAIRIILECTVLVLGFLLGGTVGIGTLIFAFGAGPAVQAAFALTGCLHLSGWLQVDSKPPMLSTSARDSEKEHEPATALSTDRPLPTNVTNKQGYDG